MATFHQVLYRNTKQKCMLRLPSVVTMFDNFRNVYFSKNFLVTLYEGGIRTGELIEGEQTEKKVGNQGLSSVMPALHCPCHSLPSIVLLALPALHHTPCFSLPSAVLLSLPPLHYPPVTTCPLHSPWHNLLSTAPCYKLPATVCLS